MSRGARYSHGCMRVADPVGLAKIALKEDKGWTAAQIDHALYNGPLNNEIAIEHKIPVHMTYFTAMVGEDGELHTFPDVYGHERRITLALEGKWDRIVKGRDHLAPVELDLSSRGPSPLRRGRGKRTPAPAPLSRHTGGGFCRLLVWRIAADRQGGDGVTRRQIWRRTLG